LRQCCPCLRQGREPGSRHGARSRYVIGPYGVLLLLIRSGSGPKLPSRRSREAPCFFCKHGVREDESCSLHGPAGCKVPKIDTKQAAGMHKLIYQIEQLDKVGGRLEGNAELRVLMREFLANKGSFCPSARPSWKDRTA
jgi:hypothetical protein